MDQQKLENEFLIFTKAQGLTRDHPFSIKLKRNVYELPHTTLAIPFHYLGFIFTVYSRPII